MTAVRPTPRWNRRGPPSATRRKALQDSAIVRRSHDDVPASAHLHRLEPVAVWFDGDAAFRQHSGGHTPGPNWPTFPTFAGRYFALPSPAVRPAARAAR